MDELRPIALLAAAAAVMCLAACGGSPSNPSSAQQPKQAVAAAAEKARQSSMHVDLTVEIRRVGQPGAGAYSASGDLSPAGGKLQIDQRNVGGDLRQEVLSRPHGHLVLYENPANLTLPKGKTWLRLDLTRYGLQRYGAKTAFLAGADQDPLGALELVTSAEARVTDLGLQWLPDRTLNTHYRARIDVVAVAKERGVKGKGLKALTAAVVGSRVRTVDVWVSKAGRVARVQVQNHLRQAGTGAELRQTSIADFSRYGERVRTTLPPAARVADYFALVP